MSPVVISIVLPQSFFECGKAARLSSVAEGVDGGAGSRVAKKYKYIY